MSAAKHTPGPWELNVGGDQVLAGDKTVAVVIRHVEGLHNARLIAASPDLLAALKALSDVAFTHPAELSYSHPAMEAARAAIEKAGVA